MAQPGIDRSSPPIAAPPHTPRTSPTIPRVQHWFGWPSRRLPPSRHRPYRHGDCTTTVATASAALLDEHRARQRRRWERHAGPCECSRCIAMMIATPHAVGISCIDHGESTRGIVRIRARTNVRVSEGERKEKKTNVALSGFGGVGDSCV